MSFRKTLNSTDRTQIGIHHAAHRNGHESGFESEQSPPMKSYYSYSCNNTITGSDIFVLNDKQGLRSKFDETSELIEFLLKY
ncbi:unnamed protein product [Schistosoma curassoni]|uniref:Uncharacterized protein n=1 Tax=Schistosoma curassoni TaxID=6186 RepID=A0A183JPM7_9TREM|nr:unnamed protein product [Schistosoma curassoni]